MASDQDVRAVIESWMQAIRARDLDRIVAHHGAELRMFDVPPPFESRGLDEYRATWSKFFAWSIDPVRFEVVDMDLHADTDVAFAVASMRCQGVGEDALAFRLTLGLRRIAGVWRIVHEHHSVPAEAP